MISYAGHANKNFYKAPLDSVYVNLLMCLYLLVQHSTGICGRDQNGIHMSDGPGRAIPAEPGWHCIEPPILLVNSRVQWSSMCTSNQLIICS